MKIKQNPLRSVDKVARPEPPAPSYAYEYEQRQKSASMDWATTHIVADRRKPFKWGK